MFLLYIIAGMLLALGIYLLRVRIRFIKSGHITEATVIGRYIEKAAGSDDSDTLHVTFTIFNQNNEEIIFKREFGVSESWKIGDKATVVYKTRNPQLYDLHHVVFLDYWGSFGEMVFLFSVALMLIIIAAGYYWAQHFFNSL
jgi:hypothetical protein